MRSPMIIQNSGNPSSRKFHMRGQLYRGHANATALFSSPVVSALVSESDDSGSCPGRGKARTCALETCGRKKMRAPLLGLARSIYYLLFLIKF